MELVNDLEGRHVMMSYNPSNREEEDGKGSLYNGFFVDHIDSIKIEPDTSSRERGRIKIIVNDTYTIENVNPELFTRLVLDIKYGYTQNRKDYVVEVF